MVTQVSSSLSAVYHPSPAAGPSPSASYWEETRGSMPYEIPAVCVSRSAIVIARRAATADAGDSPLTTTVVLPNAGMKRLTGMFGVSRPSSISARMATLVSAFVCEAMRKIESTFIGRFASLSLHPSARS